MAFSSSAQESIQQQGISPLTYVSGSIKTYKIYEETTRTLFTNFKSLEVLCEMLVDFQSLEDSGCNLNHNVDTQEWNRFFDHLHGPVFPKLVKEFWIHPTAADNVVTSYVMGKKITITEDVIGRLYGHDGNGIKYLDMAKEISNLSLVSKEIFTDGMPSNNVKNLKTNLRVWAKILLGNINHRKSTTSSDLLNNNLKCLPFFIATKKKIHLPHTLFHHMKTCVKESRGEETQQRTWIPLGKIISDVLTENHLI